ncbi:MAG: aspartate dehydrogenase [Candidatus Odinarchaeia archaeon]
MEPLKIGLIGCGAIGNIMVDAINDGKLSDIKLIAVYDKSIENAQKCAAKLPEKPIIVNSLEDLISNKEIELIVEAASQEAVREYGVRILESGKHLMIMSIGALVDEELRNKLEETAEKYDRKIYLPSGAIAGLDGIKAASLSNLKEVILTTRKNPQKLKNSPFFEINKDIKIDSITEPAVIDDRPAENIIHLFPRNINVASTLSLAGIGTKKTRVRIIADPTVDKNIHEIEAHGDFGSLYVKLENYTVPTNPRTSYLAALSAIRTLKRIVERIKIGT